MKCERFRLYLKGYYLFHDYNDFPDIGDGGSVKEKLPTLLRQLRNQFPELHEMVNRYLRAVSEGGGQHNLTDTVIGSHGLSMSLSVLLLILSAITGLWRARPEIPFMLALGLIYQAMFFFFLMAAFFRLGFAGVVLFWVYGVAMLVVLWRRHRSHLLISA